MHTSGIPGVFDFFSFFGGVMCGRAYITLENVGVSANVSKPFLFRTGNQSPASRLIASRSWVSLLEGFGTPEAHRCPATDFGEELDSRLGGKIVEMHKKRESA